MATCLITGLPKVATNVSLGCARDLAVTHGHRIFAKRDSWQAIKASQPDVLRYFRIVSILKLNCSVCNHVFSPVDPDELHRQLLTWIKPGERDAPEPAVQQSEVSGELPDIMPGLALDEGLVRVGGNVKLYLNLLSDLARDYAGADETLKTLSGEGDADGAAQMAHKLRGIANNLGAARVGAAASEIEARMLAGETKIDDQISELRLAMQELTTSVAELSASSSAGGDSSLLDDGAIQALLSQLAQEIAENNPGADDTAQELLAGIDPESPVADQLREICGALDVFDFPAAAEKIELLL